LEANSIICWIVSAFKIYPVGFPGLMITIAFGFMPFFEASLYDFYKSSILICHPFSTSKKYGTSFPLSRAIRAVYSGYYGIGIIIPSFGFDINDYKTIWIPLLAPSHNIILSGLAE